MNRGQKTIAVMALFAILFFASWQVLQTQPSQGGGAAKDGGGVTALLPMLLIGVAMFLVMRQFQNRGQDALAMRQTTARLVARAPDTRFADVGGAAECKRRLAEVVDFLKGPAAWEAAGARLPSGVLLEGPPGCGKTLLARAVAGEAQVPLFEVAASEFVELLVGVGAARVRDLFEQAQKKAPAIIFIDELDAVGRRRGAGFSTLAHQDREQTLNQLLTQLDGFQRRKRLVVIAATNRADVLDAALLRPGRFDLHLRVPELTAEERAHVLAVHTRRKPLDPALDLTAVAGRTGGFSGADLEHLVNEAALRALRRVRAGEERAPQIRAADFDGALAALGREPLHFDRLDAALVDSASQLVRPTGSVFVRAKLAGDEVVEGELMWVDATFLKIRLRREGTAIVAKGQIVRLEALEGTEAVSRDRAVEGSWAGGRTDIAS